MHKFMPVPKEINVLPIISERKLHQGPRRMMNAGFIFKIKFCIQNQNTASQCEFLGGCKCCTKSDNKNNNQ